MNVGLSTKKRAEKPSEMRLHYWLMFMSRDLVHCVIHYFVSRLGIFGWVQLGAQRHFFPSTAL